jgi:zinc-ribbon domain
MKVPNVKLKVPTVNGKPLIKVTRIPKDAQQQKAKAKAKAKAKQDPDENAEARELLLARDRLLERFTIMQADLGGAFYEMAIRDHVKLDVLTRKAAELQRVDVELQEVEEHLRLTRTDLGVACPSCGEEVGPSDAFCSNCGHELAQGEKA